MCTCHCHNNCSQVRPNPVPTSEFSANSLRIMALISSVTCPNKAHLVQTYAENLDTLPKKIPSFTFYPPFNCPINFFFITHKKQSKIVFHGLCMALYGSWNTHYKLVMDYLLVQEKIVIDQTSGHSPESE